ncbi:transglycosylase SLT domain-containing protein [Rubellimicrobium sp. CFH 75288]|uniref:transglycosylase SLT domain-containing protein n=1 Tax=Rubellimicrobium sp. CFH 75288 TaxID=2697034 RepID=UPI001412023F|nr:transglycosylase SLT domain-containing protein [Rubellimicrobium sp. CFH 75288]NAZ37655.1 transglycosylase SLT domain-containing protein [Rubellimicrobium sp. CFH 75288]
MSRKLRTLALVLLVAACGGRVATERTGEAPRDLDNACRILEQRPGYLRAFQAAERRWGVPVAVQMAIIYQESKFIPNARPPHQYALGVIPVGRQSSALGYSQALDGTWAEYLAQRGGRGARRDDIHDATDFMGWYMTLTQQELGIPLHDTENQYLAYHEGRGGYRRGSYQEKAWLMRVAAGLAERARMYDAQLRTCRR